MANRHASHPSSKFANGPDARANVVTAAPRTPYRLGGLLRWDDGKPGGLRLVRRGVALVTAVALTLLPLMQTVAAAENARVAANTRVTALSPVRLPLEVAPPAFTLVTAGTAASLSHDGAEVKVPPGALANSGTLSIRPLAAHEVARMNPGLLNATRGPRRAYRMEPSQQFGREVAITLPYDRRLLPDAEREPDLRIYWYDTAARHWTPLRRVSINSKAQTVTGWTDHFTDFITGVVNVPNHPQVEGYTPTTISSLKAADPGSKINLIEPPQADSTGDAKLSYPIELPPGRNGHQPQLAIQYDSSRSNGWLGLGWHLAVPSVDIDTRWGVPRYDTGQIDPNQGALETETYLLNGEQLAPVANRGALVPRTAEKSFSLRVEGQFLKITRHGTSPTTYWWEVTAKDGTRSLFGGSPSTGVDPQAVLADPGSPSGNIGRWMLREVIDPDGNNITFHYQVVDMTTFHGGTEPARQIYLSSINYSGRTGGADGPYQVVLKRDSVRTDPIIDGRFGFKTVTTDRLTEIDVNLTSAASPLIRSYQLAYKTGEFNKSLLTSITQLGQDGTSQFHTHTFDYFDEVRTCDPLTDANCNSTPLTIFGATGSGPVPGAVTTAGSNLVSDVSGTALSGEANASDQTHLYTGPALGPDKGLSAGFKGGTNTDKPELSTILIDLNGDGRPDQVSLSGGIVYWRPNTGTSFGSPQPVSGLPAIDRSSGSTLTQGGEAWATIAGFTVTGLFDKSYGRINEQVYFADVNGDGLPDLVNNGTVLFNQGLDANGNPFFAPGSPTPLGSGALTNTAGLITTTADQQSRAQQTFVQVDSIRRWVAPFAGTIDITGPIQLTQVGDANADGVRTAIQLENNEIFSLTIAANDTSTKQITGLTGIRISAGQHLYFRVNSINDGASDTVLFDPTITYRTVNDAAVDPTTLDETGLPAFITTASADFAFAGRPLPVYVPATGTATITGTIVKPNVTTDDVTFNISVIPANSPPGTPGTLVFSQMIAAGSSTAGTPFSVPSLALNQGDQLLARIDSGTRINLSGISFTPTLAYQTIGGAPAPTAPDGTPRLLLDLPATAQVFGGSNIFPNQPTPWIGGGSYDVTQTVSWQSGFTGRITLAVRSGGVLLAKPSVTIFNGTVSGTSGSVIVTSPTGPVLLGANFFVLGTPVFFTDEATNPDTLAAVSFTTPLTYQDLGGFGGPAQAMPFEVRVDTSSTEPFGGGYRNWWFGDYTPADPAAPIDQTLLRLPTIDTDQVYRQFLGMLPNQTGNPPLQIQTANPPNQPPNPPQILPRWQVRSDNAFVAGGLMGSTRLGGRIVDLPDGTSFGNAQGIVKSGSSFNEAGSISIVVFGHGTSDGTSGSDIDFLDFNGDGYPDVVAGSSVQATLPNGALGTQRIGLAGQSQVRQSANSNVNDTLGATTSELRATAGMFGLNIFPEMAPYNVSGSVTASHGTTTMNWDLVDVNGDGLPDLVQPVPGGLAVKLNFGYRFGASEFWSATGYGGVVRLENTMSTGFEGGAGFTQPNYSFGGGLSSTQNSASTVQDLIDVNGDGLPDLVIKSPDSDAACASAGSNPVQVFLNTGAGFLSAQCWIGALPAPIQSRSGVHRHLGLHFSIFIPLGFELFGLPAFLVINPGHNHGDSFGGSQSQVRDFDGDGYADHIQADGSSVTVQLNKRGRTNLLKSITRPLGATIALDYVRSGNTPTMPQNRWVMASRVIFDGLGATIAADGNIPGAAHYQIATFDYANGQWNRAERTFYGFASVREHQHDTTGVTTANVGTTVPASLPVFRSIIESFRTDSFYTKGLLAQQITQTGAGARFLETDQTFNVVTVPNGTGVSGLEDFTDTRFPQLTQRNKLFYEGQPTAGKQTTETFAYDGFGNVTQYADLGDGSTNTETPAVFSAIHYSGGPGGNAACVASYIVGIADRVTVTDAAGNTLRRREADVNCTTGNVTENRRFLADGSVAVTDMTYDSEGKLTNVTGPANLNGQRYSLAYTYDTTVDIYVESVTDSFSYVSNSTHDFKFGEVTSTTDENGQVVSNSYDNFGRLVTVIGPYQQGTANTTISITFPPADATNAPPVPWALTCHFDSFGANANLCIETVLFTDGLKRVVQTKKDANVSPQAGTAPTHVMTVTGRVVFDPFGHTIQQFYPVAEATGQEGVFNATFDSVQPTVSTFDILDRVTKVTIPDNTSTTTAYDFAPDRSGLTQFRTTVIDANGVRKEMFRDVRSQITAVNEFNNGGSTVFHTSSAYDPLRQVTSVTDDQGNVTSVVYDLFGRRTAINSPDAGLTTFTYDLADNITAKQTANLATISGQVAYAYQFNRVTAINYPAFPANNVTYSYGAASQRQPSLVGNVVGRITHITDGAGTEDRLYGPLGEIVQETRAIPIQGNQINTYVTKFQYDTWNRMVQMIYPDPPTGETVFYFYDAGGLVTNVQGNDDQLEQFYASNITYDKFGQRLSMTYGNGAVSTYAYDQLTRRLINVQASLSAGGYMFHNFLFSYDKVGNLTQLQNQVQFPGSFTGGGNLGNDIGGPWTKTFGYDDLYRLTSSTGTHNVSATPTFTYSFSQAYDSIHNITHKTQSAMQDTAVNPQLTYDNAYTYPAPTSAHPHSPTAIGGFSLTTDLNGNQITTLNTGTGNTTQYLFDEENRLSCANKGPQMPSPSCNSSGMIDFIYDHAGERKVKKAASPTIYPNHYYTDFGGGTAGSQFKHIFIGSERILTKKARIAPDRQHWYYHPDHLGSTAMVTNENDQLVDAVHYFPFGEVWLEERPSSLPADYFFTAKEFDPETGFYDFGARYLDPRFSKWMSADPALGEYLSSNGEGLSVPANFSLYAYGRNSPAVYVDPHGRQPVPIWLLFLGAAGGGGVAGGSWYLGSQYYVYRDFDHATLGGFAKSVGLGAGGGVIVLVGGTPVAITLTGLAAANVAERAPDYFGGRMSVEEERQWEVDAAGAVSGVFVSGARSAIPGFPALIGKSTGGAAPVIKGQNGEEIVSLLTGLTKNTEKFQVNGRDRIPDFIGAQSVATRNPTIIHEAKNYDAKKLGLIRQLKDDVKLAGPGGKVYVWLPPGAKVTKPLDRAFKDPTNPLTRMDLVRPPE